MQHLGPRQLGQALGVSESSVKRWADQGEIVTHRTSGGHRRIALAEAIRFIRESGLPVVDPAFSGPPGCRTSRREPAATRARPAFVRLVEHLKRLDCHLVIGGREQPRGLGHGLRGVQAVGPMAELVAFAEGLRASMSPAKGGGDPARSTPDAPSMGARGAQEVARD